jgi:hypothetical protein
MGGEQGRAQVVLVISINWRGRPLTDYQVIVETIGATRTQTGLTVEAVLDTNQYPTGVRISDYTIHSGPAAESLPDKAIKPKRIK